MGVELEMHRKGTFGSAKLPGNRLWQLRLQHVEDTAYQKKFIYALSFMKQYTTLTSTGSSP